jgi:hypothetical protein
MNPILLIVAVVVVLLACGGLYDLRQRRVDAGRRKVGLDARTARGVAESQGSVGGSNVQGHYGGPGL